MQVGDWHIIHKESKESSMGVERRTDESNVSILRKRTVHVSIETPCSSTIFKSYQVNFGSSKVFLTDGCHRTDKDR